MARPRKNDALTLQREESAWTMRVQGMTQMQIADKLNISQSAVSQILYRVSRRINEKLEDVVIENKMYQLGMLERAAAEAWAAWENSKKGRKEVKRRSLKRGGITKPDGSWDRGADGEEETSLTQNLLESNGDPRYLQTWRDILADMRELLHMVDKSTTLNFAAILPPGVTFDMLVDHVSDLFVEGQATLLEDDDDNSDSISDKE